MAFAYIAPVLCSKDSRNFVSRYCRKMREAIEIRLNVVVSFGFRLGTPD